MYVRKEKLNTLRFIREQECQLITGLSRTTRWRLEKEGLFPARRKITQGTIGWFLPEIEDWLNNRESVSQKQGDAPCR